MPSHVDLLCWFVKHTLPPYIGRIQLAFPVTSYPHPKGKLAVREN